MTFKTELFDTSQKAITYFNKVTTDHVAYLVLEVDRNIFVVVNDQDYRSLQGDFDLLVDMLLDDLCSE